ncbi:MAG: VWA domain-containing protein [Silvanigrellales bacterium]|nr:VWA domain-containing protein [Silvanigrellales bacterium]
MAFWNRTLSSGLGLPLFLLAACGEDGAKKAEALSAACSAEDARLAKEEDKVTDGCREALLNLLPKPESDVTPRLVAAGATATSSAVSLPLIGLPFSGRATGFDISTSIDGGQTFAASKANALGSGRIAVSLVTDYSGSMRESDVKAAEAVNSALWGCLPSTVKSQVIAFSDTVKERKAFAANTPLASVLNVDEGVERKTTALNDALLFATDALKTTGADVRLLIVHTDGQENASKTTKEALLKAMDSARVVPIVIGSFLADVPAAKELSKGRGFFVYARQLSDLDTKPLCALVGSVREVATEGTNGDSGNRDSKGIETLKVKVEGVAYDVAGFIRSPL